MWVLLYFLGIVNVASFAITKYDLYRQIRLGKIFLSETDFIILSSIVQINTGLLKIKEY
jgi:hypothetical protein